MSTQMINLQPPKILTLDVTIEGLSPLIQHQWSEKAKKMMRDKKSGVKTKDREPCNPEQEFKDATYKTEAGKYGIPVDALKASIIGAAHKDTGIEKTLVRKSLFIRCDDANRVLAMECDDPIMREDNVRVGGKSADLRYRPEFRRWAVVFQVDIDATMLTPEVVYNLINRAGFGVGICEWRPEKGGEYGRFQVRSN